MTSLSYYIVNNNFLRVADVSGNNPASGTPVIAYPKNLPETSNQQWQTTIKTFNLSTSIYTASIQAQGPDSYAIPQNGAVSTADSEVDWYLEVVTAPFGGASSFRIGEYPGGPYWTAQTSNVSQILLSADNNAETQLWTFIEVVVPGIVEPEDVSGGAQ